MIDVTFTQDDAQKLAEELKDNPDDTEKWHKLGTGYLSLKQVSNAEIAFKQCLKLEKNYPPGLGGLGSVLILKGKTKAAIKNLENCLKLEPVPFVLM